MGRKHYVLAHGDTIQKLIDNVNILINDFGYSLQGGVFQDKTGRYLQAVLNCNYAPTQPTDTDENGDAQ